MSNKAPDQSNSASPGVEPPSLADTLCGLLNEPKPKDEAWQGDSGRAVSMLAVRFLSDPSDESALRSVALLTWAKTVGVKEANKLDLKLTRWTEMAPPPLTTLAQKNEQQAALTALAKITPAWSQSYVEHALSDASLPTEFIPSLLKWARATYPSSLSFIQDFYAPQVAAAKTWDHAAALLKDAWKLLKSSGPESAQGVAEGTAAVIEALLQTAKPDAVNDKAFAGCVASLLNLVQAQAAATPAILLQPTFVMAFGRLSSAVAKGTTSKQVTAIADALVPATLSLLSADVERHGNQAVAHWSVLVPTWRAAYANWDAGIAAAVKLSPALAGISSVRAEDSEFEVDAYAAEAVFARLLPAWEAFVEELPDASRAASLSAMLHQAAGTLGISPLGEPGTFVRYDPRAHHLTKEGLYPRQVRILRPGVQVQRPDGSSRILLAALVEAV